MNQKFNMGNPPHDLITHMDWVPYLHESNKDVNAIIADLSWKVPFDDVKDIVPLLDEKLWLQLPDLFDNDLAGYFHSSHKAYWEILQDDDDLVTFFNIAHRVDNLKQEPEYGIWKL